MVPDDDDIFADVSVLNLKKKEPKKPTNEPKKDKPKAAAQTSSSMKIIWSSFIFSF